jgi:hypothetical protein
LTLSISPHAILDKSIIFSDKSDHIFRLEISLNFRDLFYEQWKESQGFR